MMAHVFSSLVALLSVQAPTPQSSESKRSARAAPNLEPQLVTLTWVGGVGDQWIQEVGFAPDGTIYAKGGGGSFTVLYSATGTKCLGFQGDLNAPSTGPQGRDFAVQETLKSPHDGKTWRYGFKQVAGLLQQPYLISPAGWKWYDWTEAQAGKLRADSRGVLLLFPSPDRFIMQVWRDGGNSTITRDPRDLSKPNSWCQRGGGSASYFLLGNSKTGEPLAGAAFAHRPQRALCDEWGRLYVSQQAEGQQSCLKLEGAPTSGFSIHDPALKFLAGSPLVPGGTAYAMSLRGNILVIGGVLSDPQGLTPKIPAQPKPGGGKDGFLAIVRLWPTGPGSKGM